MSDFDIEGAKKAGYSDSEIADYLGKQKSFDVAGARQSGYSDADIIGHLGTVSAPKPQVRAASMVVQGRPMSVPTEEPAPPPATPEHSFSELPGNIVPSAQRFGESLVKPFTDPAGTAKGLYQLDTGIKSKVVSPLVTGGLSVLNAIAPETAQKWAKGYGEFRNRNEATADAVGQEYANRYGGLERARNTLITDPVGVVADVGTLAAPAAKVPGVVGKVATLADPISLAGNALVGGAKTAGRLGSEALGISTGAGGQSVRTAAKAGFEGGENAEAFQKAMRGNTSIEDTVSTAKQAVEQIRQERAKAYNEGKADLSKDKSVMDFDPIDRAVDKAAEVGTYKGQVVEKKAQGVVQEMRTAVEDWKGLDPKEYHTPEGIDALKRTLGNIRDSTGPGTPERVAADRVYRAVRGELADQAPGYAKMMEAYSEASDKLKEVTKTLSLGEKATGDTAGRKLLSATRSGAQTNYGQRVKLIDELAQHEPTLPYKIAGHSLNAIAPQGLVGRGSITGALIANPANVLSLPAFMPRVVGEGAYYLGRGAGYSVPVGEAANALRLTAPNLRRARQATYQSGRTQEQP